MKLDLSYLLWRCPKRIHDMMTDVDFSAGDCLLKQGENTQFAYLLLKGEAQEHLIAPSGLRQDTHIFAKNSILGEMELLQDKLSFFSVTALSDCSAKRIGRDALIDWMKADKQLFMLIHNAAKRKMLCLASSPEKENDKHLWMRTAHYLHLMAQDGKMEAEIGDIAMWLCTPVQGADRIIREFCRHGLLEYDGNTVKLYTVSGFIQKIEQHGFHMTNK